MDFIGAEHVKIHRHNCWCAIFSHLFECVKLGCVSHIPLMNLEIFKPNGSDAISTYGFRLFCLCFARLPVPPCSLCAVATTVWELGCLPHGFHPSRGAWEWTAWRVGAQSQVINRLVQDRPSRRSVWDLSLYRRQTSQNHFTPRGSTLFSFPSFAPSLLFFFFFTPWSG